MDAGLEAGRTQPAAVQVIEHASAHDTRPPSSSVSSTTASLPPPDATVLQWHPSTSVFSAPQPCWQWHWDPARYRHASSHLQPTHAMPVPGPHLPPISPSGTALIQPPADAMADRLWALLRTLETQFTVFQESLGGVQSDVHEALSQLQALRTVQAKTNKSITELEAIVGVSTGSRGRGRRSRGRGTVTQVDSSLDVDGGVPEKTLVQSLASIQGAIEELLAQRRAPPSHLSGIYREDTSMLPLPLPPSVNPTGKAAFRNASPHRSVVDPPRSLSHPPPSASAILPISPSDSTLSPAPIPQSRPSSSPAGPGTKYSDASIQAYLPSPTSESSYSSSRFDGHAPGFMPVDWNVDPATVERCTNDSVRSTAYTSEYLARFSRNHPNRIETNVERDDRTRRDDRNDPPGGSTASYTQLPTPSNSPGASVVFTAGSSAATEIRSSTARIVQSPLFQTPSIRSEGVDSSMVLLNWRPLGDQQTSSTSPSISASRGDGGCRVDTQVVSHVSGNGISAGSGVTIVPELVPAPEQRRPSSLVEADDEELTPRLPTLSLETFVEGRGPRAIHDSTRQAAGSTDSETVSRVRLPRSMPAIPTPPFLTPEPSGREDRLVVPGPGQSSLGALSDSGSPRTPSLLSPSTTTGSSLAEESGGSISGQVAAQKGMEGYTNSTGDTRSTVGCGGNTTERAAMNDDGRSNLQTGLASVDEAIYVTNLRKRVTAITHSSRPIAVSNEAPSQASAGQPNMKSSERHSDVRPACPQTERLDLGSSLSPLSTTPPTPLRNTTPSDSSSDSRPDEEEVMNALMWDESGTSTPLQDDDAGPLPWIWSHDAPSTSACAHAIQRLSAYANDALADHASSTSPPRVLAIDPSMLHKPTPTSLLNGPEPDTPRWGTPSVRTLTPLTPLDENTDTGDSEDDHDATRQSKRPRTSVSVEVSPGRGRAVSGGPSASLDELASLARREPLKISLKVPEKVQRLKRKRDIGGDEAEGERRGNERTENERVQSGREGMAARVSANMLPSPNGAVTLATSISAPRPHLASKSSASSGDMDGTRESPTMSSSSSVSSKRMKKQSERGRMAAETARMRRKKLHQGTKGKPKVPVTYHVRNGRIVSSESEPEPAPATPPSDPQPSTPVDAAAVDLWTPPRMRQQKGQESEAVYVSLSSPSHASPRKARPAKSSPTKEDVWNMISQSGATWPERPDVLSQWDTQFIQCDNCDKWHHYGCVGIKSGDPRLEPAAMFICPTCHNQSARRQTTRHQDDTCARPDCPEPQVNENTELFFVEKLVGRKKVEGGGYMWLAKWDGYPMSQATWIPKENVVGDGTKLFDAFLEDAVAEDANTSQDVVLLKEAVEAGWEV